MRKYQSFTGPFYLVLLLSFLTFACKSKSRSASADSIAATADTDAVAATVTDSTTSTAEVKDSVTGEAVAPAKPVKDNRALTNIKSEKKGVVPPVKAAPAVPASKKIASPKTAAVKKQDGPATSIDAQGFTLVNGSRFFPIGIYVGTGPKHGTWATTDEHLAKISNAGFNTILPYTYGRRSGGQDLLSRCAAQNLKVIYSLTDMYKGGATKADVAPDEVAKYINAVKNSPNLLAWYINDELGVERMQAVSTMYNNVRSLDNQHIIYQVNNYVENLAPFAQTTDVFGLDHYIVNGTMKDFSSVGNMASAAKKISGSSKGLWGVVQLHDKSFHNNRQKSHAPTLDEMRNLAYQNIIGGSNGLVFYAYHWLYYGRDAGGKVIYSEADFNKRWPDVTKMIQEIKPFTKVILENNIVRVSASGANSTQYKAWLSGGKLYLVVANPDDTNAQNTFKLPQGNWSVVSNNGIALASASGSKLNVNLVNHGSGVIVLKK